jgi:hypothetical protein
MAVSYSPRSSAEAGIGPLEAPAGRSKHADFVTLARQKVAVGLVGVGLVVTVAWIGALGWAMAVLVARW